MRHPFHVLPYGETVLDDFDRGVLIGVLAGEGHFGGDGKQPHITLRMHTRHRSLFAWLNGRFPRCKLYGPYSHGGRNYMQWMARGRALVEDVLPEIERGLSSDVDSYTWQRYCDMVERYGPVIERYRRDSEGL